MSKFATKIDGHIADHVRYNGAGNMKMANATLVKIVRTLVEHIRKLEAFVAFPGAGLSDEPNADELAMVDAFFALKEHDAPPHAKHEPEYSAATEHEPKLEEEQPVAAANELPEAPPETPVEAAPEPSPVPDEEGKPADEPLVASDDDAAPAKTATKPARAPKKPAT